MWMIGFCFLPWLWIVNFLFFRTALRKNSTPPAVHKYVKYSLIGGIIYGIILLSWIILYAVKRNEWGPFADTIAVNIPNGY